jgi:hypothetical protein
MQVDCTGKSLQQDWHCLTGENRCFAFEVRCVTFPEAELGLSEGSSCYVDLRVVWAVLVGKPLDQIAWVGRYRSGTGMVTHERRSSRWAR